MMAINAMLCVLKALYMLTKKAYCFVIEKTSKSIRFFGSISCGHSP